MLVVYYVMDPLLGQSALHHPHCPHVGVAMGLGWPTAASVVPEEVVGLLAGAHGCLIEVSGY